MALNSIANFFLKSRYLQIRFYSIQPPEWLGGKNILEKSGKFDFPEHSETLEERLTKIEKEKLKSNPPPSPKNLGSPHLPYKIDNKEFLEILNRNKKDKNLAAMAKNKELIIEEEKQEEIWSKELKEEHIVTMATYYGIFNDLFSDNFFYPTVDLKVNYDFDEDYVTPVYYGNIIMPTDAQKAPLVTYPCNQGSLWTLLMVNPDESLTDQNKQYIHWMVTNIPENNITKGEIIYNYLPPIPAKGTGFHRNVFILFEQKQKINIDRSIFKNDDNIKGLEKLEARLIKTNEFYNENKNNLFARGLLFFQSQWDESVRIFFRNYLEMGEPVFEYIHQVPYHPPPKKYPHRQPFNVYLDRYRDIKDLNEESLRQNLKKLRPFSPPNPSLKYPLVHNFKRYKPTWLLLKEEMMSRKLSQFQDKED